MKYWVILLLALWCVPCLGQDYTCSADKPCELGCCSNTGVCGMGPDFCGDSCISNCDSKSDCNPGWGMKVIATRSQVKVIERADSIKWSAANKCPLNVCCSEYGFCGTTKDFCGNKTIESPSCSGSSASKRTIGYYESWGITRKCDKMYPECMFPLLTYILRVAVLISDSHSSWIIHTPKLRLCLHRPCFIQSRPDG
jgi:chitinase